MAADVAKTITANPIKSGNAVIAASPVRALVKVLPYGLVNRPASVSGISDALDARLIDISGR